MYTEYYSRSYLLPGLPAHGVETVVRGVVPDLSQEEVVERHLRLRIDSLQVPAERLALQLVPQRLPWTQVSCRQTSCVKTLQIQVELTTSFYQLFNLLTFTFCVSIVRNLLSGRQVTHGTNQHVNVSLVPLTDIDIPGAWVHAVIEVSPLVHPDLRHPRCVLVDDLGHAAGEGVGRLVSEDVANVRAGDDL